MQPYFNDKNLDSARTKFKIRTKMLEKIPGNFKNRYKNQENGLKCDLCPAEMTQNHCLICPGRQELRKDLDMENLDDLVLYFRQILSERSLWTNKAWDTRLGCWSTFNGASLQFYIYCFDCNNPKYRYRYRYRHYICWTQIGSEDCRCNTMALRDRWPVNWHHTDLASDKTYPLKSTRKKRKTYTDETKTLLRPSLWWDLDSDET